MIRNCSYITHWSVCIKKSWISREHGIQYSEIYLFLNYFLQTGTMVISVYSFYQFTKTLIWVNLVENWFKDIQGALVSSGKPALYIVLKKKEKEKSCKKSCLLENLKNYTVLKITKKAQFSSLMY